MQKSITEFGPDYIILKFRFIYIILSIYINKKNYLTVLKKNLLKNIILNILYDEYIKYIQIQYILSAF